ncbi:hypothetical protein IE53DRAFT_407811 [Violaceomyces palustris]|uniref:Uncharacterized protein n=1 Tax=Violaceomyces palustris TaxID=1673888 RepID=A0ACD0NLM5_9BASI|nr:hypothetical protein IE53DRAFT_407811 [Violaceomyces palustris]
MPASTRRSTPRRGRSSSVTSNASAAGGTPSTPASSRKAAKKEITTEQKIKLSRPTLPTDRNPRLQDHDDVPVKLQVIRREGKNIIIGRVKLPTVNGSDHAFLLKRFDTNAIAASSMFRLAFPYADGEAESGEMRYLDARYDTDRANGGMVLASSLVSEKDKPVASPETPVKQSVPGSEAAVAAPDAKVLPEGSTGVRLQGTWIPCSDALQVAEEYGLTRFAKPLIEATAKHAEDGSGPILTSPSKTSEAAPRSTKTKRQRTALSDEPTSPSVTRTRTTRTSHADGSEEVSIVREETIVEEEPTASTSEAPAQLTTSEIEAQIQEAKALAAGITASNSSKGEEESSKKRRAVNDRPTADLADAADDDEEEREDEGHGLRGGRIARTLRRGTRVARRRPIATTAGVLTAAGAVGAGAVAWLAGGNLDVAVQTIQQSVQSLGITGWFF